MLDRTLAPAFHKSSSLDILPADIVQLPNGVWIYTIAGGQQEVLKVEVILKAGRWFEPKTGAAHFAATILSKGTSEKSSFDIARIFDRYGAHLEVNPGLDVVSISLFSLTRNLRPVLDLLLEILRDAVYDEKEFEQAKAIFLQNLQVNKEKTSFQAGKLFRRSLFGESHPYGKELEENINDLKRDDLLSYNRDHFKDLLVVVSGKIDSANAGLIENAFATLRYAANDFKGHNPSSNTPSRVIVEKDDSVQVSVRIGKRFIGRKHPDYFDVLLLNHILGGYFGSRLMKNIREEKGWTYGIYSSIHTLANDNYMVIGADVNKENLEATFEEVNLELLRLRDQGVESDELDTARNHFIGSLQSEISTPFSHADKWKNILLYGLTRDYYSCLIERLDQITQDDLVRAAETYYGPETFYQVAVG